MRAPKQEASGTSALSYVKGDFEKIGWGPIENPSHDLGTDLFIQVRDERRFDRTLLVAAQVKGGPSWFKERQICSDGTVEGWWFYESSTEHFDDWVHSGIPHLIVLYDFSSHTSYWVHVTSDRCVGTGKGCKILVPSNQKVNVENLGALLDVAAKQRAASTLERKAFYAGAAAAPPARRLRYALLTPRLIAPHANTGYERSPEPEEYLALLVRRRSHQLGSYKRKFPDLADSTKLRGHSDWRWRFVAEVENWLEFDDSEGLKAALASAPNNSDEASATAVLAAALFESGDYAAAESALDTVIADDECAPVDLAWLLLHRAALKVERGDSAAARADVAEATKALRGDDDDPTATLLAGVAADVLFATAGFGSGDLADVINSNDTAPAWWRAQTMSWALGHLDDDAFDDWVNDNQIRLGASHEGWENLEASRLNAALSADHDAWRSISARQGRLLTRRSQAKTDSLGLLQGLNQMRRAGNTDALTRAVDTVWAVGPVSVVREVAELAPPSSMTRSTAYSTIKLWGVAADAMTTEYASELATWCSHMLADHDARLNFRTRLASTFHVDSIVLESLHSLLPVASATSRRDIAELLLTAPNKSVLTDDWMRVVMTLDEESLRGVGFERLSLKAKEIEDATFSDAILHKLALYGDSDAQKTLLERANTDMVALELITGWRDLPAEAVAQLKKILVTRIAAVREAAAKRSFGFGGSDAPRLLARLNILHPDSASWDSLFEFLSDPVVAGEHKEGVTALFVGTFPKLAPDIQARLREVAAVVASSAFVVPHSRLKSPEAAWQLQVVSTESEAAQAAAVATLLSGSSSNRRVAARVLGANVALSLAPALHALLVDADRGVRTAAAFALGALLARPATVAESLFPALGRVGSDLGAAVPASFLNGLSESSFAGDARVLDTVELLQSHDSFLVRRRADDVVRTPEQ